MPQILHGFVTSDEIASLLRLADTPTGWLAGRQGTGYDRLWLREQLGAQHPVVARALAQLGTPYGNLWDTYLIRYVDGAYVADHTDPAQLDRCHRRINVVLAQPRAGGELYIDGAHVPLAVGDAVLFEPDREVHRVSPVVGTRLLFSVGAWV